MLGILLIFFIGRYFYYLAEDYGKQKWVFAILGVLTYYAGTFVGGLIIGIGLVIMGGTSIEEINRFVLSFMVLPFGVGLCYGLYYILKSYWEKNKPLDTDLIDQIGGD